MTAALNIGSRALNANLSALQVIGHNIANVNTDGYSRQSVHRVRPARSAVRQPVPARPTSWPATVLRLRWWHANRAFQRAT